MLSAELQVKAPIEHFVTQSIPAIASLWVALPWHIIGEGEMSSRDACKCN